MNPCWPLEHAVARQLNGRLRALQFETPAEI
jgi:hypothetical protein